MTPRLAAIYRQVARELREQPQLVEYARREWQRQRDAARTAGMPEAGLPSMAEQASSLGALAAARGAARLSPAELAELAALRLQLLQRSPKICVGSWFGGVTQQDLMLAMDAAYSDAEVQRWFELNLTAMRLELRAQEPLPALPPQAVGEALAALLDSLPAQGATALAQTLELGTDAAPEAACQALQLLLSGGLRLPEQQRAPLLLAFIFPMLVDESGSAD
jgi:hypothetical protein